LARHGCDRARDGVVFLADRTAQLGRGTGPLVDPGGVGDQDDDPRHDAPDPLPRSLSALVPHPSNSTKERNMNASVAQGAASGGSDVVGVDGSHSPLNAAQWVAQQYSSIVLGSRGCGRRQAAPPLRRERPRSRSSCPRARCGRVAAEIVLGGFPAIHRPES